VFGLIDLSSCPAHNISPTREMTVIFEYGDPSSACTSLKNRANDWIHLSTLPIGTAAYNTALQALTDDVTLANSAPGKPNKSAINQVRTNEIALSFPWQLREFTLKSGAVSSNLLPATIKQTPDPGLFRFGSGVTADFMEEFADAISCERHKVPESYQSQHFLGSHADYAFGTIWHAPAAVTPGPDFCTETPFTGTPTPTGTVRHKLSLNTCDDCHSGETLTQFTHVKPTTFPAALSSFVQGGVVVTDPGGEIGVSRKFDDLTRRGQILEDLAVKSCRSLIPRINDPLVLNPRIQPTFKLIKPQVDPTPVSFSRQQQVHTFVH
ncbi:MAG TPA: hypothetical protein PK011_08765, partial [Marinagarivorans sp.]|nr:hypothetical protein [Marinagarivorans sp.]